MKNLFRTFILTISVFILSNVVYADAKGGLETAKNQIIDQVKPIVNNVVVPIIDVLLVACLAFAIAKAVISYRRNMEIEFGWIILLVVGIILVSTFNTWGWNLIP